jgi:hypothetical protein
MLTLRRVAAVVVALVLTFGCDTAGASKSQREGDRGADVSAIAITGDSVDRSTSDSLRASGAFCRAATVLENVPEAGVPPQTCVAPCVWALIRSCLPEGQCGADNDWSLVEDPFSGFHGFYRYKVFVRGRLCFGFSYGSAPPYNSSPEWSFTNGHGSVVAQAFGRHGAGLLEGRVVCNAICEVDPANETDVGFYDGGIRASHDADPRHCPARSPVCPSAYSVDPNRPDCAAWRGLSLL